LLVKPDPLAPMCRRNADKLGSYIAHVMGLVCQALGEAQSQLYLDAVTFAKVKYFK